MSEGVRLGKYLKATLTVGDYIVLNLAYFLTCWLTPYGNEFSSKWIWLIANVSYIPSVLCFSGCHSDRILYADRVVLNSIKSAGLQIAIMITMLYAFDLFEVGLRTFIAFFLFSTILLSCWWVLSRQLLKNVRRKGFNFKKVVIIGTGKTASALYNELQSDAGYGFRVLAFFDGFKKYLTQKGNKILPISELGEFSHDNEIDIIYYTGNAEDMETMSAAMRIAGETGADFVYVPPFNPLLNGQFQVGNVGNMSAMTYTLSPLHRTPNKIMKRMFDLAVSIPFLIFSPILFVPIAIGIKMTSPGPVFFKQKRTGIYGRDFLCYKFRTMKVNSDSDKLQATKDDPRKTKFGDFLRRTSLDELPQFLNVLIGNMSVVGPRPHMVSHTEEYSALIDKYMVRHAVKPGITGWAQVNGYRGGTKHLWQMEKRVQYDVWYIRHWNLILDVKIVFLTMFNGLRGDKNAY